MCNKFRVKHTSTAYPTPAKHTLNTPLALLKHPYCAPYVFIIYYCSVTNSWYSLGAWVLLGVLGSVFQYRQTMEDSGRLKTKGCMRVVLV
jgi:hypothetical protein